MQITDALKELAVKIKGSGNVGDITEDQIAECIKYIADNWVSGGSSYTLPEAKPNTLGGVKQATAVTPVSAANAGTIGSAFAQAEVQRVATLADANKTAINDLIAKLKASGVLA